MKILFFDLEKATEKYEGRKESKICEFGYVVTDENFVVTARGNALIDPKIDRKDWDWYVVKKVLTRKKSEYLGKPAFDAYYPEIREMILSADCVVGHTLSGDVKALNDECKRYDLPSIDFDFYDECIVFQRMMNSKNQRSVLNILRDLEIAPEGAEHDAECDAYNTMLGLKAMAERSELPFAALLARYPDAKDRNHHYEIDSQKREKPIKKKHYQDKK